MSDLEYSDISLFVDLVSSSFSQYVVHCLLRKKTYFQLVDNQTVIYFIPYSKLRVKNIYKPSTSSTFVQK